MRRGGSIQVGGDEAPDTVGTQVVYPNRPIKLIVPFPAGGGIEVVGGSAADFTLKIAEDTARWSKVIKDANITIQ